MNENPFSRNDALAGLQQIAQTPLARGAVRYWWVSVPLFALGWHYYKQRQKEGKATVGQLVHDMVPAVGLVGTLLTLNTLIAAKEAKAPQRSPLPPGPIKDADFTAPIAAQLVQ